MLGLGRWRERRARDEAGAVAILFALLSMVLVLLAGFIIDLGMLRDSKIQAQNAADASALAAGVALYPNMAFIAPDFPNAVAAAKKAAATNIGTTDADWVACTDPNRPSDYEIKVVGTPCISFKMAADYALIRVRLPDVTASTPFSGLFVDAAEHKLSVAARAKQMVGGRFECGLCIVGPGAHNIQNGDVIVSGADTHINGTLGMNSGGGISTTGGSNTIETLTPSAYTGTFSPFPEQVGNKADPLQALPMPPEPDASVLNTGLTPKNNPCTDGPGIYASQKFQNNTCTLQSGPNGTPGVYVLPTGSLWELSGNANTLLTGSNVIIYLTCGTTTAIRVCGQGEVGGSLDLTGNGQAKLTAPTTGAFAGMLIVADRLSKSDVRLTGNGQVEVTGTIYTASGTLDMRGNGCADALSDAYIRSLIIVGDLTFSGQNGCLRMDYVKDQNVSRPVEQLHLNE